MARTLPVKEGFIPFAGYRTWYRVVGDKEDPGKLPLLCLHGGPGATWHHMEPYEALAEGRRVIFYEQLGCGNTRVTEPHETSMWTPELYVEEVQAVRREDRGTRAPVPIPARSRIPVEIEHAVPRGDVAELVGEHVQVATEDAVLEDRGPLLFLEER